MKILLVAINAKYIHSNLAVYCLKSYAAKRGIEVELTEYTINHRRDDILMDIYQRKPDVVAFSCYIWNLEFVQDIAADLYKVLPDLEIWGGGPEVSYDAEKFLAKHPEFRGIMKGEGERTFCELAGLYQIYGKEAVNKLDECHGIVWRDPKGEISQGLPQAPISLDEVPFIYEEYENMMPFENRILYYETSRGCPFSCSYCLSSIDKRVRLRSMELVEKELPTEAVLVAMQTAALAGVDVRLMLPYRADNRLTHLGSCSYLAEALRAGVKVYFYKKGFLHSKLMVSDDELSTVGSTNVDFRSFEHNFEVNAFIYDTETALQMREIFLQDQRECVQVFSKNWEKRPWHRKAAESIVRLLAPLL